MKKKLIGLYYGIIPLLIIGISYHYTSFILVLFTLAFLLCLTNRHTIGVYLLIFGGPLAGLIRSAYPFLPLYGLLVQMLGSLLVWDVVSDLFKTNRKPLIFFFSVLVVLGLFYLIGPRDEYANEKFYQMCVNGVFAVFGYYAFDRSQSIDSENLTRLLLLSSLCMSTYLLDFLHVAAGGLFDYNWFRDGYMELFYANDKENLITGYQSVGMAALFGIAVYLSSVEVKTVPLVINSLCATQIILMSGARQALVGLAVVIALRMTVFRKANVHAGKHSARILFGLIVSIAVLYMIFLFYGNLGSDVINKTLKGGDTGRSLIYLQALSIFTENKLFGIGIGGFHAVTGVPWPHNFFLELLCETGLVGTILLLGVAITSLVRNRLSLLHLTKSDMFFFLILLVLFVRVMFSSDFRESIELFSAVSALIGAESTYERQ